MNPAASRWKDPVATVMVAAAFLVGSQVGGRAGRDAMFLTNFAVTSLPIITVISAILSCAVALGTSRLLATRPPERVVPWAFGGSAVLMLGLWATSFVSPRAAAAGLFLQVMVLTPVVASAFWILVNERLDPRTARREMGWIGAVGAVGGLSTGLLVGQLAPLESVHAVLPLLAILNVVCLLLVLRLVRVAPGADVARREAPDMLYGLRVISRVAQLRSLALLILLGTVSAALLDYVFKSRVSAAVNDGAGLMRLFSSYHTIVSLLTLVVQAGLSAFFLQRLGLAATATTHPAAVATGSLAALALPGLPSATIARATDSVLSNSLFRSAYEVMFTPIAPHQKRSAKAIVDVGGERAGDAIGGALVAAFLFAGPRLGETMMLLGAAGLSIVGLTISVRLQRLHVQALESSLMREVVTPPPAGSDTDPGSEPEISLDLSQAIDTRKLAELIAASPSSGAPALPPETEAAKPPPVSTHLAVWFDRVADLRSADLRRIIRALRGGITPDLVPHALPLLARDDCAPEAVRVLRESCDRNAGQLVDALLDSALDLNVRRRIPRVLASSDSEIAIDGLFAGLEDRRFEIRVQCGRALARIRERGGATVFDRDRVFSAVLREVRVERRIWEGQREMALGEEAGDSPFEDQFLRKRADASLEHVFNLLSLVLPPQPLQVAYGALHTNDAHLRGTALEYLESVLPPPIREGLWPFIEGTYVAPRIERPRAQILDDLLRSNDSIRISLDELRRVHGAEVPKDGDR